MSGRVAKRLRSYLAALPGQARTRRTLSRLRRAWAALPSRRRGRTSALPQASKAVGILMSIAPAYPDRVPQSRTGKRGGTGLLKPLPRVGGPRRHPRGRGRR